MNKERKYNPAVHVLAGGAAGAVASAVTTPLDVVKTLLNTQETQYSGVGVTRGMWGAASQVAYKGLCFDMHILHTLVSKRSKYYSLGKNDLQSFFEAFS